MKNLDDFDVLMRKHKYKMVSESVDALEACSTYTNVVYLTRTYSVPWYRKKPSVLEDIKKYANVCMQIKGYEVYILPGAWADWACKTVYVHIRIVPNNGKVVYTDCAGDNVATVV